MQAAETMTAGISRRIFPLVTAKKLGTAPRRSAAVVKPKAIPGFFGSLWATIPRVMGIVILKRIIPITETIIFPLPKIISGREASKVAVPVRLAPKKSAAKPPMNFPKNAPNPERSPSSAVVFHSIGIAVPPKERIVTERSARPRTAQIPIFSLATPVISVSLSAGYFKWAIRHITAQNIIRGTMNKRPPVNLEQL